MKHKLKMFYYRFTAKFIDLWQSFKNHYSSFKESPYFALVSLGSIVLLVGVISSIIAILPDPPENTETILSETSTTKTAILVQAAPETTTIIETTTEEITTQEETTSAPAIIPMDQLVIENVAPSEQGNGHSSTPSQDSDAGYVPAPSEGNFFQTGYSSIIHGIDVSHWQGDINWRLVKNAGYQFAFVKVCGRGIYGGGLYTDEKYVENIRGALSVGMNVGAYVFSQAITVNEAIQEASLIVNCLKSNNLHINYPVVFDWETGVGYRSNGAGLSVLQMTNIVNAFISTVESAGYEVMVYGNAYDLSLFDINSVAKNHRVWYARYWSYYRNYDNYFQSGKQTPTTTFPYEIWQYKDTGVVPGISEKVDMNVAFVHSSIKLNLKESTFTLTEGSTFNPLRGVSAKDDSGYDYTSSTTYTITNAAGQKKTLNDALSNSGTYTITYKATDRYSIEATATAKLIVRKKPILTLASYTLTYFAQTDSTIIENTSLSQELINQISNNILAANDNESHNLTDKVSIIYPNPLFISDEAGNTITDVSLLQNSLLVCGGYTVQYLLTDSFGATTTKELTLNILSLRLSDLEYDITAANSDDFPLLLEEALKENVLPSINDAVVITYDQALTDALANKSFEVSNIYTVTYTIDGLDSQKHYRTCHIKITSN